MAETVGPLLDEECAVVGSTSGRIYVVSDAAQHWVTVSLQIAKPRRRRGRFCGSVVAALPSREEHGTARRHYLSSLTANDGDDPMLAALMELQHGCRRARTGHKASERMAYEDLNLKTSEET